MASFGENLRRERELRGISLRDVAEATKISTRFLQALENDRVELLPGGVFRKCFVREYARAVGLDPDHAVADFLFAHPQAEAQRPRPSSPLPAGTLAVGGVILLGVALALARSSSLQAPRTAKETAPPSQAPRVVVDRAAPVPVQASAPGAEPAQGLVLTLSARERCWVSVQVDGRSVLNRELGEGETQTLEAAGEIVLSVGNAGGLAIRLNDHPGLPLGRSGEVKRNIVITKQSLPSLVEDLPPAHPAHS
jgi:cytoskeletal protein RodZ